MKKRLFVKILSIAVLTFFMAGIGNIYAAEKAQKSKEKKNLTAEGVLVKINCKTGKMILKQNERKINFTVPAEICKSAAKHQGKKVLVVYFLGKNNELTVKDLVLKTKKDAKKKQ